ncbi:MAG: hypothetical protein JXR77_01095 [Lentisphaeria bacterium]|nr:hypothetical protein [Lentisphaeria bacterium]
MASSQHLKDLKAVWGQSCHSMWVELLSLRCAATFVQSQYGVLDKTMLLTDLIYAPESKGRLNDVTPDLFLQRLPGYLQGVVTDRIVLLSAAFELYFTSFLDAYLQLRPKYYDANTAKRTADGDRVYGQVRSARGPVPRIEEFARLTGAKIKSLRPHFPALSDVYTLRNVLAHRAGLLDAYAASQLQTLAMAAGQRVVLSTDQLLCLASPVLGVASALDRRLPAP